MCNAPPHVENEKHNVFSAALGADFGLCDEHDGDEFDANESQKDAEQFVSDRVRVEEQSTEHAG
jgi:hypothetical protein